MTIPKFLKNWDMTELELDINFLRMKWAPQTAGHNAASELSVELLTRISTPALPTGHGDEPTALDSVHSLFPTTRQIIKTHGRECNNFARVAIPVLNQIVRPFAAKGHREAKVRGFSQATKRLEFREDLAILQDRFTQYPRLLARTAKAEDSTAREMRSAGRRSPRP